MLSLPHNNSTGDTFFNMKCAEVHCQTLEHFAIVCTFCELKTFEFDDFLLHFKNVHVPENKLCPDSNVVATTETVVDKDSIKYGAKVATIASQYGNASELQEKLLNIKLLTAATSVTLADTRADTVNDLITTDVVENQLDYQPVSDDTANDAGDTDMELDDDVESDMEDKYKPTLRSNAATTKKPTAGKLKCSECNKSYKLAKFLEHHMNKRHNKGQQTWNCPRCAAVYDDEWALSTHVQTVHHGFPCEQCDKVYKSKEALQLHVFIHTGVRQFICDVENCGKSFYNPKHLSCHKRIVHTLERNYVCEMCGFRTKAKPALIVHKRSHTGEKPFACKDCDRRFASQSLLGEHKAMHSTERPHKCDVCNATFARAKALYHHKHLHLGIKKFLCKVCGKAYAQAAGLSGHMRKHKAEQF